jgi:hypothetical protein
MSVRIDMDTHNTNRTRNIFYDTEFIERGPDYPLTLISIGMVDDDGRTFYRVSSEFREEDCNDWVKANVLPYLGPTHPCSRAEIAHDLMEFIGADKPRWYGYYSAYDHVLLCQLFGTMIELPKGWPMYTRDIKQMLDSIGNPEVPKDFNGVLHNALEDALWNKKVYEWLLGLGCIESNASHRDRMERLLYDMKLDYNNPELVQYSGYENTDNIILLGNGRGYRGFTAEFFFNPDGSFDHHGIWE